MNVSLTNNSFAAILLTVPLSPNREEYVRPLAVHEFQLLQQKMANAGLIGPGVLYENNITQLMLALDITEEEALRMYTLLHRDVQMNYAIEDLYANGIRVATCYDD